MNLSTKILQDQVELPIVYVLSYIQSKGDFKNVIQHMTLDGSKIVDSQYQEMEQRLYNGLGVYGRSKLQRLKNFKEILDNKTHELIYPATTKPNTPFNQNMEVLNI